MSRRWLTIPTYFAAWTIWIAATPLWLLVALLLDAFGSRRGTALRGGLMLAVYLSYEVVGLSISFLLWLWRRPGALGEERWQDLHFRLEGWWARSLLSATQRIFAVRMEVEDEQAELGRGPYTLFVRHASTADTLVPPALVIGGHGLRLRVVLKKELLWDPCLDVVGRRIPNAFVDRGSSDSAAEIDRIREIARGLGSRDGVLIYPEGTRSSARKRAAVVERLRRNGDERMSAYAATLDSLLPPRLGGPLALLEAAHGADVVFCAHTGFEGATSFRDIRDGRLIGRSVRVKFWRVPAAKIPKERDERIAWLLEQWKEVDRWVTSKRDGDLG